nr:proteasome subunit beta type-2 [Arenicola marina]
MECIIGIQGKDFVILASDTTAARSIVAMKSDHDKMCQLSSKVLMAMVGESGDCVQFAEYIAKNIQLYKMRNGYELSATAAANFTRKNMADFLRSRNAYMVNMLIAGHDKESGPELYYLDYLASMVKVPYGVHGYGSFFSLSVMDRYYRDDLTKDEALHLLQQCIDEIRSRFIVNLPAYKVRIVTESGVEQLTDMKPTPK